MLLALKHALTGVIMLDMSDEIIELPNRTLLLTSAVLFFFRAVLRKVLKVGDYLRRVILLREVIL
jgi:hypothetical protein